MNSLKIIKCTNGIKSYELIFYYGETWRNRPKVIRNKNNSKPGENNLIANRSYRSGERKRKSPLKNFSINMEVESKPTKTPNNILQLHKEREDEKLGSEGVGEKEGMRHGKEKPNEKNWGKNFFLKIILRLA